jgi:hypothetical protein
MFFAPWTVDPPWKLRASNSVVPEDQPVLVKPAPESVVVTATGQLSKCCGCFQ